MNLIAIETSCDETAAAVVAETGEATRPWQIRSNIVASQAAIHREWGGVVPELASRQHVRDICGVYEAALAQAGVSLADIGGVAGPPGPRVGGGVVVGGGVGKRTRWAARGPVGSGHPPAGALAPRPP